MPKQHVEGYNVHSDYDGPYLPGADFDPDEVYANAGDPEAAAKVQEEIQAANPSEEPIFEPEEEEEPKEEPVITEPETPVEPEAGPGIKITGVE